MKYQEKCECCGHVKVAYTIPMNKSMANAFVKFADRYMENNYTGLKKGKIGLTNSQYTNFQNLRHFGIIEQAEKGGRWHLTALGREFYLNDHPIITPAGHIGGETLPPTHEAWHTHETLRQHISLSSILPERYKQREEYQEEKGFNNNY